jgi:xanthine dehydrogenase molybdopterin-binding subunit B
VTLNNVESIYSGSIMLTFGGGGGGGSLYLKYAQIMLRTQEIDLELYPCDPQ